MVGVISDQALGEPGGATRPQIFLPISQAPQYEAVLLVGTARNPQPIVEDAVARAGLKVAVAAPRELNDFIRNQLFSSRIGLGLVGMFSVLAMLLSYIGIYSTLTLEIDSRKKEWALRQALGAPPRTIRRAIWAYTARHVAAGLSAGLICSWVLTRVLDASMLGGAFSQPHVFRVAALTVVIAGWSAAIAPAIAASTATLELLRGE